MGSVNGKRAHVGPLRASSIAEFRGNGVRDVRCPDCTAPLAMHVYMDGDYLRTMPSKYVVRLPDGTYGRSRDGELGGGGARAVTLNVYKRPTIAIHCITRRCSSQLVLVDFDGANR